MSRYADGKNDPPPGEPKVPWGLAWSLRAAHRRIEPKVRGKDHAKGVIANKCPDGANEGGG
jgi:hypothetical protein